MYGDKEELKKSLSDESEELHLTGGEGEPTGEVGISDSDDPVQLAREILRDLPDTSK